MGVETNPRFAQAVTALKYEAIYVPCDYVEVGVLTSLL